MRAAFARALVEAARQDPRVLLLTGDHGYALFEKGGLKLEPTLGMTRPPVAGALTGLSGTLGLKLTF